MFVPLIVLLSDIICIGLQRLIESTEAAAFSQLRVLPPATADSPNATNRPQGAKSSYARVHDFPPTGSQDQVDAALTDDRARLRGEIAAGVEHVVAALFAQECVLGDAGAAENRALSRLGDLNRRQARPPPAADKMSTLDWGRRCPVKSIML